MRNGLQAGLCAVLVSLAFGGCSCDDETAVAANGVPRATPASLAFGERCNENLHYETLTVSNAGAGNVSAQLSIEGRDAVMFEVNPTTVNLVGTGNPQTVTVTYKPSDSLAGDQNQRGRRHEAEVVLSWRDGDGNQKSQRISIDAEVADVDPLPRVSFGCGEGVPVCGAGVVGPCCTATEHEGRDIFLQLSFGDTKLSETASLPLQIRNIGCGEMALPSVVFDADGSSCGAGVGRLLGADEDPLVVPGGQELPIALEFTPTDACNFLGELQVASNDASMPTATFQVSGTASAALLELDPRRLDFGVEGRDMTFTASNTGTAPLGITSMEIVSASSRFSIVKIETVTCEGGNETGRTTVQMPHTLAASDARACGPDEVEVTVRYAPNGATDAVSGVVEIWSDEGFSQVRLSGGAASEIYLPEDMVFFMEPEVETCGEGSQTIEVCNRGDGPLEIASVTVAGAAGGPASRDPVTGHQIFTKGRDTCSGASIDRPACCEVEILFRDGNTGGSRAGRLEIASNDPHTPEAFVALNSFTTPDMPPSAFFAPAPDETAPGRYQRWNTLDATGSSDDHDAIVRYEWRLQRRAVGSRMPDQDNAGFAEIDQANPNAGCPADVNDGECFRFSQGGAVLEYFPDALGQYVFSLRVHDAGCVPPHASEWISSTLTVNP